MTIARKTAIFAISLLAVLVLSLVSPMPGLTDEPDCWTKNEIRPLLTEGTASFEDDEASEFVHAIQWDKIPLLDEATWRSQADGILDGSNGTIEVAEALEWVNENIKYVEDEDNYGVAEAWANPEQTLNQGSGDGEDLAFLLASLLKWHTDEVDTDGGDLVYVECGFLVPPDQDLRFWAFWWDASSELGWQQLDPTTGKMGVMLYLGVSTLWLNDDYVFGFLPGYYPEPAAPVGGFDKEDFAKISDPPGGGFGDDRNNYAWSMTESNGDLYVGTGRNTGYIMLSLFWPGVVPEGIVTQITDPTTGGFQDYLQFLDDMQAEIWRYRNGDCERVHLAGTLVIPTPQPPPEYIPFPVGVGYRIMTTFNGAIYAGVCGFGDILGFGSVPNPLMLTSPSGDPGTWETVNHTGLEGTNTRGMTVHNGKLYVGTLIGDPGRAAIFASADPANDGWTKVADFSGTTNTEVIGLKSFNDCLYVSTQGTLDLNTGTIHGFEVWRSTVEDPANPDVLAGGDWTQIVKEGAGDSRNYWGASMEVLDDHLYVGSISLPIFDGSLAQTFKGFELIRMDKDDNWELVIGSYPEFVGIPNATTPERGIPISGLPAGFGAPLNFYGWSLEEHDGVLYLGTLDLSALLSCLPVDLLTETFGLPEEQMAQMQEMIAPFAGSDLWKTSDGITWEPVSLDGFDNPHNYGFRTMVSGSFYVGTANPFAGQGCEVWKALRASLKAQFSASPTEGEAPLAVEFRDQSAAGWPPYTYKWDFDGNGTVDSSEANPGYTYRRAGTYDVTLTVEDNTGEKDYAEATIIVALSRKGEKTMLLPEPADFAASYLYISPGQVMPNQQVEISINIANHGGEKGSHSTVLYINGYPEQSQTVGVSPGSTKTVVFRVTKPAPGTYEVSVEGQQGQFTVLAPAAVVERPVAPGYFAGGLSTAGIIAIVVVGIALILGIVLVFARRE